MKKEHLTPSVIEFAAFTLKPGIIEERLLECSQELQTEFLSRQPGFIKRELVRKSETEFVDMSTGKTLKMQNELSRTQWKALRVSLISS